MAEDSGSARSATRTRRRAGAMAAGPPRMSREVSLGRNRWKLPTVSRNMTYQWKPKKHGLLNGKITEEETSWIIISYYIKRNMTKTRTNGSF